MAKTAADKPTVLVLLGCFSSATEASGPNLTMLSNASALSDRFRFKVVGAAADGERPMEWTDVSGMERLAVPYGPLLPARTRDILVNTPHDLLVCNSFFDRTLTIPALAMRRYGLVPKTPTIVAPRGEFNEGALALKPKRKLAYIQATRMLNLLDDVHLQATDEREADAIRSALPFAPSVLIGPNVRRLKPLPRHRPRKPGEPLRIAFLSRIDRIKNLDLALKLLARSGISATFDVIGPVSDAAYWRECEPLMNDLPEGTAARQLGPIPLADVSATLANYDLMLLPTAGENFGHAIVDSLEAGTPVLISDRTPWRGLAEAKAGVDLPLHQEEEWVKWLRRFAQMNSGEMQSWRQGARRLVQRSIDPAESARKLEHCYRLAMATD